MIRITAPSCSCRTVAAASTPACLALGEVIHARAREIAERWLERVRDDIAHRHDVELTQLRDGIPDYLEELARLLTRDSGDTGRGTESWARVAREHGVTRVRFGFDIDQLVREFYALRKVIEAVAAEDHALTTESEAALADLIDAAVAESVRAYIDRRDFEARRAEAEHIGFLIHELRNPLSAAMQAETVVSAGATTEQARALAALARSHRRLSELIDGVLLAERHQAGRIEPEYSETTMPELLELATEVARKAALDKHVAFEVRCEIEGPIHVDVDLASSAIQNLVDNAVKYTDSGHIEVSAVDGGDHWEVHVRDTCPGLSDEELRTIFEPFRRGATAKAGTGLGLSIARRSIEAQGGSIRAESPGPTGCHFWITLPKR